ncbi:Zn-dependent enzyme from deacylase/carboxypeptidase superfamily [Ferrimonas balearica DSM 9799]|uniref:Zn-dependent enzyme from deacylase/carboxypeptidase superfamily n=1 Tax=Ferrimonas balearica (strain DSM 9799 / CCM 4581 / KCTC 23876 / PAT) TaxID=550540 RepID=E1SLA2_FERBD|nr:M14 family metallocarboxypeptidase [Ferrimonas balearica]ADN75480.1 Zn-dependent enzyme from deacylase/carboxypeptidase superfamily [Ferrimonas balearica DSM 9799]
MTPFYPIGTPGQPWGEDEKAQWLASIQRQRSYRDEVLSKIDALRERFDIEQYGALSYDSERYPLFAIKSRDWQPERPKVLVTGGVHGYETSGVQGALAFLDTTAAHYAGQFDLVVLPCISPWGYEVINRWNPQCVDPNRSFMPDSPSEEAAAAMAYVAGLGVEFAAHLDLHETTDSDQTEFRPALAARDGKPFDVSKEGIPDGFYTVDDSERASPAFQKAIIDAVRQVTHIAPADENGLIIGAPVEQEGVINYPKKSLFLCGGMTDARYVTTTEVYPDSPKASPEQCNLAQIAAIRGALDYLLAQ